MEEAAQYPDAAKVKTYVSANAPISGEFTSAEQVITLASLYTIAHGLGVTPRKVSVLLKCQTAEAGYSVGDEVVFHAGNINGTSSRGVGLTYDATNLKARFSSFMWQNINFTTGTATTLTQANWKLILRAWA